MRSFLRQIALLLVCVAVALLPAIDARNAGSASRPHDGFESVVRSGSAVRTPPKALMEKKELLERRRKELGKEYLDRKQQAKRLSLDLTASGTPRLSLDLTASDTPRVIRPSFFAQHKAAVAGILALTFLERGINKIFMENSIKFPAQLAGCVGLFITMSMADFIRPGMGESMYSTLLPGTNLLAKWFPVLFVPGLVMLPLAPSIGNGMEVRKSHVCLLSCHHLAGKFVVPRVSQFVLVVFTPSSLPLLLYYII
jgi:hypothetical protein